MECSGHILVLSGHSLTKELHPSGYTQTPNAVHQVFENDNFQ